MNTPQDGGPAFPVQCESLHHIADHEGRHVATAARDLGYHPGMSMREWFAGMALQGLLASGHFTQPAQDCNDQAWMTTHPDPYDDETGEKIHKGRIAFDFPEAAWKCADSMIKHRKEDA